MNQTLDDVRRILDITGLKIAQLHGDESPRFCKELGAPVIKSFETFNDGSLEKLKKFDAFARNQAKRDRQLPHLVKTALQYAQAR